MPAGRSRRPFCLPDSPLLSDENRPRLFAGLGTLLIMGLLASLLLRLPAASGPAARAGDTGMRLVLLPPRQVAPPPSSPRPALPVPPAPTRSRPATVAASVAATAAVHPRPTDAGRDAPAPVTAAPASPRPPEPASPASRLYTSDGRIRIAADADVTGLPPGTAPGLESARDQEKARRILERPDPINYHPTRFDKDWKSDGNLFQLADQALDGAMKKLKGKHGGDQPAIARPPPQVRFNPALHERQEDLGSEATGDAYKAAPIAFEKAPDLKGGASAAIVAAMAELERDFPGCAAQRKALLGPVRERLQALQHIEHALAHGADPVMAEHLLPQQADQAYDMARRALWYARDRLARAATCRGGAGA